MFAKKKPENYKKKMMFSNPLSLALLLIGIIFILDALSNMYLLTNPSLGITQAQFITAYLIFKILTLIAGLVALVAAYREL